MDKRARFSKKPAARKVPSSAYTPGSATAPLVFETCLHKYSAKGYEIAAVSLNNLENSHIKLRIVHE